MIQNNLTRETLFQIRRALDHNAMDHEAIADAQNVPVELVEDIATGRRYSWLFQGEEIWQTQ